jgi:hypothetical protein
MCSQLQLQPINHYKKIRGSQLLYDRCLSGNKQVLFVTKSISRTGLASNLASLFELVVDENRSERTQQHEVNVWSFVWKLLYIVQQALSWTVPM